MFWRTPLTYSTVFSDLALCAVRCPFFKGGHYQLRGTTYTTSLHTMPLLLAALSSSEIKTFENCKRLSCSALLHASHHSCSFSDRPACLAIHQVLLGFITSWPIWIKILMQICELNILYFMLCACEINSPIPGRFVCFNHVETYLHILFSLILYLNIFASNVF